MTHIVFFNYNKFKTHLVSIRARSMKITIIHHSMALSAATHRSHFLYSWMFIANQVISTHSLSFQIQISFLTFLEIILHRDDIAQKLTGSFTFLLSWRYLCHIYRLLMRFRLREILLKSWCNNWYSWSWINSQVKHTRYSSQRNAILKVHKNTVK